MPNWKIGLLEIGEPSDCLYSFCAPPCASAAARNHLDQSSICFNIICLNPIAARWLIRTAYEIPGDANNDLLVGSLLCCCSINQVIRIIF